MAQCSGTGSSNSTYELILTVDQASQDTSKNTTTLNWNLVLKSNGDYGFSTWGSTSKVYIDNTEVFNQFSQKNISAHSQITIANGNTTVQNNSDGTKNVSFSASYEESNAQYFSAGTINCSGSMELSTIPRASTVTCTNGNIGESVTIKIDRKSNNFTYTVSYKFGTLNGTIAEKTSETTINWKIPTTFYDILPTSNSGWGSISCITYNGNEEIGSTSCTFTALVTNSDPIFTDFTYHDGNSKVTSITENDQVIIQKLSEVYVTVSSENDMVAQNGATPGNYYLFTDDGSMAISDGIGGFTSYVGKYTYQSGMRPLRVTATDSRNNSTTVTKNINVIPYDNPIIYAEATRKNNFENEVTIKAKGSYSKIEVDGENKNTIKSVTYKYKEKNGEYGESNYGRLSQNLEDGTWDIADIVISLDNTKAYEIEVTVEDNFSSTSIVLSVGMGQAIFVICTNKEKCYVKDKEIATVDMIVEKPVVLFEGTTIEGGTATENEVTLDDYVSNYDYIEIYAVRSIAYGDNETKAVSSIKVDSPDGRYATLPLSYIIHNQSSERTKLQFNNDLLYITGKTIKRLGYTMIGFRDDKIISQFEHSETDGKLFIYKVVGYKN